MDDKERAKAGVSDKGTRRRKQPVQKQRGLEKPRRRPRWSGVSCLYSRAPHNQVPHLPGLPLGEVVGSVGAPSEGSGMRHLEVCIRLGHCFDTGSGRAKRVGARPLPAPPVLQDPQACQDPACCAVIPQGMELRLGPGREMWAKPCCLSLLLPVLALTAHPSLSECTAFPFARFLACSPPRLAPPAVRGTGPGTAQADPAESLRGAGR